MARVQPKKCDMKRIWTTRLFAVTLIVGIFATSLGWGGGRGSWSWAHKAEGAPLYPVDAAALEEELRWLEASQTGQGALAQNPEQKDVVPYFANLAAMALVRANPGLAQRYMDWYLARLNRPDRFGRYGTIYDYRIEPDGREVPTYDYDSADSYAATLLSLASWYVRATGDIRWAQQHHDQLQDVAEVIVRLQDGDGLVWAKPGLGVKLLMDNSENYRGLVDWSWLLNQMGHGGEAATYRRRADWIWQGIETQLWNPWRGMYEWGLGGVHLPSLGPRWYPDSVSQLYPIVYGVIDPQSDRARLLYAKVMASFPRWAEGDTGDPFPWAIAAYAAVLVGDTNSAQVYLNHSAQHWPPKAQRGPWYAAESGYLIRTVELMDQIAVKKASTAPAPAATPAAPAPVAAPTVSSPETRQILGS
ncbi:MAG: hypothetical protein M1602_00705 [Firmicutes bacterium]|nr:hypothetical protein [Bacillota bacterium]